VARLTHFSRVLLQLLKLQSLKTFLKGTDLKTSGTEQEISSGINLSSVSHIKAIHFPCGGEGEGGETLSKQHSFASKTAGVHGSMQCLCHDPSTKLSAHGSVHCVCHDPSTSASVHGSMQYLCHDPSTKSSVHGSVHYWCHDPSTTSSVHASIHYWCQDLQKTASVRNSLMQ